MKAAIIGAGPCGLTAAWDLARRGIAVTVIEREPQVGGLCKTVRRSGYQFDLGGHRFISRNREMVEDIRQLMGQRLMTRERRSAILFPGQRFEYPLNMADIIRNGSLAENARFALGYALSLLGAQSSSAPAGSFQNWAETRFGKPLYAKFFGPYTKKLWGVEPGLLSGRWAPNRISVLNAMDAALKAMGFRIGAGGSHARKYLYPMGGIGEIFETMAGKITELGGRILTGWRAESMTLDGSRVLAVTAVNGEGERLAVDADVFLFAAPLRQLAEMIHPGQKVGLPSRGLRFLNIILDGVEEFSPYTWQYTPSEEAVMTRIQEPKRRSPFSSPEGKTSIMLEIPCDPGSQLWEMEDGLLLEMAVSGMKPLGYELDGKTAQVFSTWAPDAYPLMTLETERIREKALSLAGGFTNLCAAGRQGRFEYIFMDQAMLAGRRWARKISGGGDESAEEPADSLYESGSLAS